MLGARGALAGRSRCGIGTWSSRSFGLTAGCQLFFGREPIGQVMAGFAAALQEDLVSHEFNFRLRGNFLRFVRHVLNPLLGHYTPAKKRWRKTKKVIPGRIPVTWVFAALLLIA